MNNKLKDLLIESLGIIGYVVWFIIGAITMFTPLVFLDFSFLGYFLVIIALFIPFIGDITEFIIWIWSLTVVVSEPIDGWSIFYFIAFALYFLTQLLPFAVNIVINIIALLFGNKSHND